MLSLSQAIAVKTIVLTNSKDIGQMNVSHHLPLTMLRIAEIMNLIKFYLYFEFRKQKS